MPSLIRKRNGSRVSKRTGKRVETTSYQGRVPVGENDDGSIRYLLKTFKLEREAKAWVTEILERLKDGGVVEPSEKRLADYLDEWMENAAQTSVRANTFTNYGDLISLYLKPRLGHVTLAKLNPGVIQAAYRALETEANLGPRSVRLAHSVLHNSLDQAVRWRYLRRNPSNSVTLPKQVRQKFDVFTSQEASDFMTEANRHRLGPLVELATVTGMRPGELLGLQWSNVDLRDGLVRVIHTLTRAGKKWALNPPKTKRGRRTVPLPAQTTTSLKAWKKRQAEERMNAGELWQGTHKPTDGFVFTRLTGNPLEQRNVVNRLFKPTLRRLHKLQNQARELAEAGVAVEEISEKLKRPEETVQRWIAADRVVPADLRMYDLRHSCATLLLLAGVNPKVVSERLGHSSVVITLDTYSHVLPTMQESATEKLAIVLYGDGK